MVFMMFPDEQDTILVLIQSLEIISKNRIF